MSTDNTPLMGADNERTSADGLPVIDRPAKDAAYNFSLKMLVGFPVVGSVIGFGLAYGIYSFTADKALVTAKITALAAASNHWTFFSGYVFHRAVSWLNMYPIIYKEQVSEPCAG